VIENISKKSMTRKSKILTFLSVFSRNMNRKLTIKKTSSIRIEPIIVNYCQSELHQKTDEFKE
jgi:hypothetical protein